jgi:hypothetical protein
MKWAHLPNAGGLYDQNPDLLDKFSWIFGKIAEQQKAEQDKSERDARRKNSSRGGGRPMRVRNR